MYHWQIYSFTQWIVFHFVDGFLCCEKMFQFGVVLFVYFFFCFLHPRRCIRKNTAMEMPELLLSMFSCRIFMVLSLIFKSLVHFEYILAHIINSGLFLFIYLFVFLQVFVQFSQHHSLKRLPLPCCILLPPLSNISWPKRCEFISELSSLFHTCLF